MKWRCWAMILHRDLGYFFTGVVIIYAISGLAVNHADSWNSSFVESNKAVQLDLPHERAQVTEDHVRAALASIGAADQYESFDFPSSRKIKIYLKEGSVLAKLSDGSGTYETIRPRWFLYYANRLHLNPAPMVAAVLRRVCRLTAGDRGDRPGNSPRWRRTRRPRQVACRRRRAGAAGRRHGDVTRARDGSAAGDRHPTHR